MKKLLFTILFLYCLQARAEVVKKIDIEGNSRISDETIKVYGDIILNKDYSQSDTNLILKKLYETDFFETVDVNITNGVLKVKLKEYDIIHKIEIEGEKRNSIREELLERMSLREKGSFIKSKLKNDIQLIKKLYASQGFNFLEVDTKIEKFTGNRLNLLIKLNKGEKTSISKIYFIGDKKVKEKRLRDIIVSEEDKFWKFLSRNTSLNYSNIELDKRLLTNYYLQMGYYDVQILSSSAEIDENNYTTLTYDINAGTRYRINKISSDISPVLDKNLFLPLNSDFKKVSGKYYSPFIVKNLLEQVDLLIANNDLQFVEHSVKEIINNDNIEIKINIFEGSKELVERINVKGNNVTNESVIRGELLIDEGDPFNKLKLEQSIAKLKSRNIFGEIKYEILDGSNTGQRIIDVEVEEKPTGEISAGAGIGTDGGSFAFNVKENNFLGRGISVDTYVDVSAETVEGAINVREPNYNQSGNELFYFISTTRNDSETSDYENSISTTGIGTKFEQYRDIYLAPSVTYTFDDLKVGSTASDSLKKQEGTFSELAFDYSVSQDKRNRAYMPTDGHLSSFSQTIPVYADSPYLKNSYYFSKYNSFSPDVIGSFKFIGSTITGLQSEDVRISKRLFIPSRRLRGFEAGKIGPKDGDSFVGGNYSVAMNFEASLPNLLPENTRTDVGVFYDVGNLWGVDYDGGIEDSNKWRSSVGLNTSWMSPIGPFSFIFTQNVTKAATDVTESFNFRLGTTF